MLRSLFIPMLLTAVLSASTGCTVCQDVYRNVCLEPGLFNWKTDWQRSRELYLSWARQAWYDVGVTSAACTSTTYEWGFREGFADFVFAGGTGEPPAMPPREFWNAGWRADGAVAADEWFAGYRHGASVAREGGFRERAVVRSAVATDLALTGIGYVDELELGDQPFINDAGNYPLATPELVEVPPGEPIEAMPQLTDPNAADLDADSLPAEIPPPGESDAVPAIDEGPAALPTPSPANDDPPESLEQDRDDAIPDLEDLLPTRGAINTGGGTKQHRQYYVQPATNQMPVPAITDGRLRIQLPESGAVVRLRDAPNVREPIAGSPPKLDRRNPFRTDGDGWKAVDTRGSK